MSYETKAYDGRYLPWMPLGAIHYQAIGRYSFCKQFVLNKTVLDCASGEGHGSFLLSQTAQKVVGIDIDAETVEHAKNKYKRDNLEFMQGDCTAIPIPSSEGGFDIITSLETLEHIDERQQLLLLREFSRLIKKDGLLVISTPNVEYTKGIPNYDNPYHKKELTFDEFDALLSQYFSHRLYFQQSDCFVNFICSMGSDHGKYNEVVLKVGGEAYIETDIIEKMPHNIICVASNEKLQLDLAASIITDADNTIMTGMQDWIAELTKGKEWLETQYLNYKKLYEDAIRKTLKGIIRKWLRR